MSKSPRQIEVFTGGCAVCEPQVDAILAAACPHCEVTVHDLSTADPTGIALATRYGVQRLPAVVINGRLADCCATRGPDLAVLRAAGLGVPHDTAGA